MWEAYREGYDDYRYLYTLEQLIAEAKKSPKPARRGRGRCRAAAAVRLAVDPRQPKYKHDNLWSPAEFDVYRWIVAQQIMAVEKAMRE